MGKAQKRCSGEGFIPLTLPISKSLPLGTFIAARVTVCGLQWQALVQVGFSSFFSGFAITRFYAKDHYLQELFSCISKQNCKFKLKRSVVVLLLFQRYHIVIV